MPRCGCASDQCSCFIVAGPNTTVSGSGTANDPYVVSAATQVITDEGGPVGSADSHWIGEIIEYGGATAPSADYVPCDGRALSRAVYATLFARLGTFWGAGDGSSTFNVPNTNDRVVVGSGGTYTRGATGGAAVRNLTADQLPPHAHDISHDHGTTVAGGNHDHQLTRSDGTGIQAANIPRGTGTTVQTNRGGIEDDGTHTHVVPAHTGSSGNGPGSAADLNVMQPYVAVPKYIRVQGGP